MAYDFPSHIEIGPYFRTLYKQACKGQRSRLLSHPLVISQHVVVGNPQRNVFMSKIVMSDGALLMGFALCASRLMEIG